MKNVGHSVAANTTVGYELFLPNWRDGYAKEIIGEQRKFCDLFLKRAPDSINPGILLFPDEPFTWHGAAERPILAENINRTSIDPGGQFILVVVVGCVNYQPTFSSKTYQSGFLYEIVHAHGGSRFFEIGRDVSMDDLRLIRYEQADFAK